MPATCASASSADAWSGVSTPAAAAGDGWRAPRGAPRLRVRGGPRAGRVGATRLQVGREDLFLQTDRQTDLRPDIHMAMAGGAPRRHDLWPPAVWVQRARKGAHRGPPLPPPPPPPAVPLPSGGAQSAARTSQASHHWCCGLSSANSGSPHGSGYGHHTPAPPSSPASSAASACAYRWRAAACSSARATASRCSSCSDSRCDSPGCAAPRDSVASAQVRSSCGWRGAAAAFATSRGSAGDSASSNRASVHCLASSSGLSFSRLASEPAPAGGAA
jgi:hypothetical protein